MIELLLNGVVTLLVIIDPLGLVPLFLTLTPGLSGAERQRIAFVACVIAFAILGVFALAGLAILDALGISLAAFRVAGGLFLFAIAFELVFERRQERKERTSREAAPHPADVPNLAAFPLAIPLMAGPGAIAAVILLSGDLPSLAGQAGLLAIIALVLAATFALLSTAGAIDRLLGPTGRAVITRLLGVLLGALAVQFVADGVIALAGQPRP